MEANGLICWLVARLGSDISSNCYRAPKPRDASPPVLTDINLSRGLIIALRPRPVWSDHERRLDQGKQYKLSQLERGPRSFFRASPVGPRDDERSIMMDRSSSLYQSFKHDRASIAKGGCSRDRATTTRFRKRTSILFVNGDRLETVPRVASRRSSITETGSSRRVIEIATTRLCEPEDASRSS